MKGHAFPVNNGITINPILETDTETDVDAVPILNNVSTVLNFLDNSFKFSYLFLFLVFIKKIGWLSLFQNIEQTFRNDLRHSISFLFLISISKDKTFVPGGDNLEANIHIRIEIYLILTDSITIL